MKYTVVADSVVDRERWKTVRRCGVTATDVPVLARGGAAARARLLADKLGSPVEFVGNEYTRHGVAREGFIASWVEEQFGISPSSVLIASAVNPRYLATPDGLSSNGVAECKTTSKPWLTVEDIPARYFDQMQWQMFVAGVETCVFAWEEHKDFVPTHMEPKHLVVSYDRERVAVLRGLADGFLAQMDTPYEPSPYDELVARYLKEKAAADEAEAVFLATKKELESMFVGKPAENVVTAFGNLSWSTPKPRQAFDQSAFKTANPELHAQFIRSSPSTPRLYVTALKGT